VHVKIVPVLLTWVLCVKLLVIHLRRAHIDIVELAITLHIWVVVAISSLPALFFRWLLLLLVAHIYVWSSE